MSYIITHEKRVTPLVCGRCRHYWEYSGKNKYVATCPICHVTVYISKHKVPLQNGPRLGDSGHSIVTAQQSKGALSTTNG
jgi:hypothetical protein